MTFSLTILSTHFLFKQKQLSTFYSHFPAFFSCRIPGEYYYFLGARGAIIIFYYLSPYSKHWFHFCFLPLPLKLAKPTLTYSWSLARNRFKLILFFLAGNGNKTVPLSLSHLHHGLCFLAVIFLYVHTAPKTLLYIFNRSTHTSLPDFFAFTEKKCVSLSLHIPLPNFHIDITAKNKVILSCITCVSCSPPFLRDRLFSKKNSRHPHFLLLALTKKIYILANW